MTTRIPVSEVRRRGIAVASRASLQCVNVSSVACQAKYPRVDGPLGVSTALSFEAGRVDGQIVVIAKYSISAENSVNDQAWAIDLALLGAWDIEGEISDFVQIDDTCFALATGVMTLHPYARELVQNLSVRTGYPALAMDILLSPLARPDDDVIEIEATDGEVLGR